MKNIAFSKEIPLVKEFDVIVAGGGTSGVIAAVTAARNKARTLLIEPFGFLGGTQGAGFLSPMVDCSINGIALHSGIGDEINSQMNAALGTSQEYTNWYDNELLKFFLDEIAVGAGIEILLHTQVVAVQQEDSVIKNVVIHNKNGLQACSASVFIDCTGDADLAFYAGAGFESGREDNGKHQPVSLGFRIGNIETAKLENFLKEIDRDNLKEYKDGYIAILYRRKRERGALDPYINQAIKEGILEESDVDYFQFMMNPARPGEASFNCPELDIDPLSAENLSNLELKGRKIILRLYKFCRKFIPGFEKSYIANITCLPGIRDSRRIIGKYKLTSADYFAGRKFEDGICKNNNRLDIHGNEDLNQSPEHRKKLQSSGEYHDIPFRTMLPLKIDNLIVAGRSISSSFEVQSSYRVQHVCRALGQAAGTAAALCIKDKVTPEKLDIKKLRETLTAQGASV